MTVDEIKELIQHLENEYIWFEEIWNDYKDYENKPKFATDTAEKMRTLRERINDLNSHLELLNKSNQIGRPSLGVTKKVSITLPEEIWETWEEFLQSSDQSKSAYLRSLIIPNFEGGKIHE